MPNLGYCRVPMTTEDVLNRFRTFRAVKLQPVWSYRYERRLTRPDEHVIKGGKGRAFNFRRLWGGIVSLLFVSRTKTRVLRTRDDLCYHCGPFPACVCKVFNHLLVQMSFSRTSEDRYGYPGNECLCHHTGYGRTGINPIYGGTQRRDFSTGL